MNKATLIIDLETKDYILMDSILQRKGGLKSLSIESKVHERTIKKYVKERKGQLGKLRAIKKASLKISRTKI